MTPQIIADVTRRARWPAWSNSEASLLGAAILARGLVDARASLAELSAAMVPPARHVDPGAQAAFYQDKYEQYLDSLPLQQVRAIMTSTPLHFHWHYTDVDRAFWAEHLEDWLPRRIIDAHTHVADPRLRLTPDDRGDAPAVLGERGV